MLCCAVMETDLYGRGKFEGCDEDHMRFGNIEGREGEPCRMINFRSRSCYTLDLAPHRDDTRSMRFCAYYYVVTRSQPVGGEKRRYLKIRETKKKAEAGNAWCVLSRSPVRKSSGERLCQKVEETWLSGDILLEQQRSPFIKQTGYRRAAALQSALKCYISGAPFDRDSG